MNFSSFENLSDSDKIVFCNWLKENLTSGPVQVTFLKKDGTERKMLCTLKPGLVESYEKKTERQKTINEDVCPVFDLDKKEWRSFRYDSITAVEVQI